MSRLTTILGGCLVSILLRAPTFAQSSSSLIGQREARQVGLERMWFTQVDVDAGRGGGIHLTQHVSSSKSVTIYEVTSNGGRFLFCERDVDQFGAVIGPEKAKKAAEIKLNDLTNLKLNPKLQTLTVPQITLYAVTDAGVVQAIDSETGRTLWKLGLGNPRHPTEAAGVSDDYVAVVNGSELYLLKAANGEFVWRRTVVGSPGAGPAITSHLVFVPMVSGAMEAYQLANTKAPPAIYHSQGHAMWQPVYTGTNVAWPTDRGHLYVSGATQNRINFRMEANEPIGSPASVMYPGKLVVSSVDGFVYCLQESNGTVLWRFSSGEPILETPVVYGDSVYAVSTDGNLFAIDSSLGQERWSTSGLSRVIAASQNRLYCLKSTSGLVVLDRQNGSRLGELATDSLELSYINKQTDRVLLASRRGLVQCFREIQQEFPLIHVTLTKKEESTSKAVPTKKAAAKSAEEKPVDASADPFGGAATPEKKPDDKPAEKGEKKSDDPFGSE